MPLFRPIAARDSAQALPSVRGLGFVLVWICLILGFLMVATPGVAQVPQVPTEPDVNLTWQGSTPVLERGECTSFDVTVTNSGAAVEDLPMAMLPPEEVSFSLSQPPQGWRVSVDPSSVELERGESETVTVRLCALENAPADERASSVLTATLTPASPADDEQSDQVTLSAQVEEERLFGIPWDFPPWVLWVVLGSLVVIIGGVLMSRRQVMAGVVLECDESNKEVGPGRGTSFPVRLRNEGRGKDIVSLTTSPVPHGWDTFLPIVDVPLEAGDEQTVWISVKSPDDARESDHVVVKVFARSSSTAGEQASLDLVVTVREPYGGTGGSWGPSHRGGGGQGGGQGPSSRSVYEPEDAGGERSRTVAVKRRKE